MAPMEVYFRFLTEKVRMVIMLNKVRTLQKWVLYGESESYLDLYVKIENFIKMPITSILVLVQVCYVL